MTLRVLRAADRAPAPWRNGGGVTREIASAPAAAAFDWRVSLAEVAGDGPFSVFPGIDRTLTVVEGEGMDLLVGGEHHIVDEPLWPHDFPGDQETYGHLLHGPVVNLNVMYRRDHAAASTAVVRGTVRLIPPPGGTLVAVALEDGAVLEGAALGDTAGRGAAPRPAEDIRLHRYDAVLATGAPPGVLRTHGYAAVVALPGR